jgi:GcrA cell cycle regulator
MSWKMQASPWPARDAELTELWAQGLSSSAIGVRMTLTKNAVIGRARRLGLPARPSPIGARAGNGRTVEGAAARSHRATAYPDGLPAPEGMVRGPGGVLAGDSLAALGVAVPVVVAPRPVADFVAAPRLAPVIPLGRAGAVAQPCCWPIGEPRTPGFRFCEAPGIPGRSYCAAHHAVAYVGAPAPRSEAQVAADEARRVAALGRMARGEVRPGPWGGV